jgi:hypothetical protein
MTRRTGKNGAAIGRDHAESFQRYLEATKLADIPRSGTKLNKTLIAEACGFDRQVFRTNPACKEKLEDVSKRLTDGVPDLVLEIREQQAGPASAAEAKIDQKYLLALADNAALRKLLERYRNLESLMLKSGKLPPPTPRSLFDFSNRTQPTDRCSPSR